MNHESSINPSKAASLQKLGRSANNPASVEVEPTAGNGEVPIWLLAVVGL